MTSVCASVALSQSLAFHLKTKKSIQFDPKLETRQTGMRWLGKAAERCPS